MEECLNFAIQIGEMTPEQAEEARRGMEMMQGEPQEMQGMMEKERMPEGMMPAESTEEMQQQIEQFAPPPTESPQSFFDAVKKFLASLISF